MLKSDKNIHLIRKSVARIRIRVLFIFMLICSFIQITQLFIYSRIYLKIKIFLPVRPFIKTFDFRLKFRRKFNASVLKQKCHIPLVLLLFNTWIFIVKTSEASLTCSCEFLLTRPPVRSFVRPSAR